MVKAILTAFDGKLQSEPQDICPMGHSYFVPHPFEDRSGGLVAPQKECPPHIAPHLYHLTKAGVFERTGRMIDGCEEFALVYLRDI